MGVLESSQVDEVANLVSVDCEDVEAVGLDFADNVEEIAGVAVLVGVASVELGS